MNIKEILSPSEFEILERITLLGETQKEVAQRTYRSVLTVQTTLRNAYAKLGISKATEAALLYCAEIFDITEDIATKKMEVLRSNARAIVSTFLIAFCLSGISLDYEDDQSRLRRRARRRQETEVVILRCNISA